MTAPDRGFDPTTQAEFETLVKQLIDATHENHIDVEGGIDVRHPSNDVPDWTVEITRLSKRGGQ
jgi:ABC-type transporter Mla maintaining outer membrane lipid asymmetry ATPase subunit MlaF